RALSQLFYILLFFFFSSRRRHTRSKRDWSSDVCSSDLVVRQNGVQKRGRVIVIGRVEGNDYETRDGEERSEDTILADYVGLSLRSEERRVGKEGRSRRAVAPQRDKEGRRERQGGRSNDA